MSEPEVTVEEVRRGWEMVQSLMASLDDDLTQLVTSEQPDPDQLAAALLQIKRLVSAMGVFSRPPRNSKKPPRGLGYGDKKDRKGPLEMDGVDDAMVVASLPWFGGNLSAAIRDHMKHVELTHDAIQIHAKRIRGRRADIVAFEGDQDWQTSTNWLGDLIRE